MNEIGEFVTGRWIMDYLKISKSTYKRMIKRKELKPVKLGNLNIFKKQDVINLVKSFPEK